MREERNLMDSPFSDFKGFRLMEIEDTRFRMMDLKGDMFSPSINDTLTEKELKEQEIEFEKQVFDEGVWLCTRTMEP